MRLTARGKKFVYFSYEDAEHALRYLPSSINLEEVTIETYYLGG